MGIDDKLGVVLGQDKVVAARSRENCGVAGSVTGADVIPAGDKAALDYTIGIGVAVADDCVGLVVGSVVLVHIDGD